jgi:dihydroflavonol-4-reductase
MIFVTGGTGLVGAHLLYELTLAGKSVKALKRETSDLQQVLKHFHIIPINLTNYLSKLNG